jgi:hypothetical protein
MLLETDLVVEVFDHLTRMAATEASTLFGGGLLCLKCDFVI